MGLVMVSLMLAGAGKTTTLMGCVDYLPKLQAVLYCAFRYALYLSNYFRDSIQIFPICLRYYTKFV